MNKTTEILDKEIDPVEPIKSNAWRNLHFLRSGLSGLGEKIYPTEEDAKIGAEAYRVKLDNWIALYSASYVWRYGVFSGHACGDYSHVIQIPVKS